MLDALPDRTHPIYLGVGLAVYKVWLVTPHWWDSLWGSVPCPRTLQYINRAGD